MTVEEDSGDQEVEQSQRPCLAGLDMCLADAGRMADVDVVAQELKGQQNDYFA